MQRTPAGAYSSLTFVHEGHCPKHGTPPYEASEDDSMLVIEGSDADHDEQAPQPKKPKKKKKKNKGQGPSRAAKES